MLARLQQQLSDIYQVGSGFDIRDFLITDQRLAKAIGGDSMLSTASETLLMCESNDSMALSLFLDSDMLERLEAANPLDELRAEQLDDLWKVMEGLSHFNCMVWKTSQDRTVSLLELELQAEIDKFVGTMQLALGQRDTELTNRLHSWLFDDVSYNNELDEEQVDRYRAANEFAARFCRGLRQRLMQDDERALSELRKFYRLQLTDKISHIHTRAWSVS
ncbi:MAG: hypothetical protein OER97_10045 [Gammaproteobacteria bacterium]|nr:hypothetical protein [Gammaproteobacteria bacterium]